jgi:hypothetical protein
MQTDRQGESNQLIFATFVANTPRNVKIQSYLQQDSNPRSQFSGGQRPYAPLTASQLYPAHNQYCVHEFWMFITSSRYGDTNTKSDKPVVLLPQALRF